MLLAALASMAYAQAQSVNPAYEIIGQDTTCQIFVYAPSETNGLHVAYLRDDETWHDIGRLCGSDYGSRGTAKRMCNPYVVHANDGTWRLLFGVDATAPCLGAAFSEDLVSWRPQDYPQLAEKGISDPIMFQMDDGTFDIYFKAADGTKRYVQASEDFRHFEEFPDASTISDEAWMLDTATVAGRHYEGNLFDVPKVHLDYICNYFAAAAHDAVLSSETMKDDGRRFAALGSPVTATLTVDPTKTKTISDKLIGVSLENMSYVADGGLYAELVQNRDFEYSAKDHEGWTATTAWQANRPIQVETDVPLSPRNPHYVVLAPKDTLFNKGWNGITAQPEAVFDFSVFLRSADAAKNQLLVQLVGDNGEVYAKEKIKMEGQGWKRYQLPLVVNKNMPKGNVRLALTPLKNAPVCIDMVSLFPHETFKGHGLRKDLAEAIAALHPRFVRFTGDINRQTHGLGSQEYFQFCEDIGAEPMPVVAASASSQEILNLIEWANGDPATSQWAKQRADGGHSEPFHLKMIGIGNEPLISTDFEKRCEATSKAIKAKYPDMVVCAAAGSAPDPSANFQEGWRFAKAHRNLFDMVGERCDEPTGWFLHHQDYYDDYDRTAQKVCLGGYASQTRTLEGALAEAIHLCNMERNGDVVAMTSYANNDSITSLAPSYITQRLFGVHAGDTYVSSQWNIPENIAYRVAASVVRDSQSGKTYLKLVNALPATLTVTVEGMSIPESAQTAGFGGKVSDNRVFEKSGLQNGQQVVMEPYSVKVIVL